MSPPSAVSSLGFARTSCGKPYGCETRRIGGHGTRLGKQVRRISAGCQIVLGAERRDDIGAAPAEGQARKRRDVPPAGAPGDRNDPIFGPSRVSRTGTGLPGPADQRAFIGFEPGLTSETSTNFGSGAP